MEDIGASSFAKRQCSDSFKPFLDELPKIHVVRDYNLYNFNGFWYSPHILEATKSIQSNFVARDDDILLTSSAKTGSTWLKALVYCIMHEDGPKSITDHDDDPLATTHPAVLVPTLESQTFVADLNPDLSSFPSPRIFHTHIPYVTLPESVKINSGCKIVYIIRNPKDTFVSLWYFINHITKTPLDVSFERFCKGVHVFGPFFDHVLQYWNESLKSHEKILFLKYEDLKKDTRGEVKRLASFLGKSLEDEEIDRVISRCSLDRLKNLKVNKSGVVPVVRIPNSSFFRLGVVGDWKNNLTPEMKDRLDQITNIKLEGSGLHLDDA